MNHEDSNGETPLFEAVRSGKQKAFELLVELGASIDQVNSEGKSLLQLAKEGRKSHLIKFIKDRMDDTSLVMPLAAGAKPSKLPLKSHKGGVSAPKAAAPEFQQF